MSRLLSAVGAVLLLMGAFLLYVRTEILDASALGDRAEAALIDDVGLRLALAPPIAAAIADATGERPSNSQVVVALEDPRVAAAFGVATQQIAETVFRTGSAADDLDLSEVASAAVEAIAGTELEVPSAAIEGLAVIDLDPGSETLDVLAVAEDLDELAIPLLIVAFALLAAGIASSPGIAAGLARLGVAVAAAAALGVAALLFWRSTVGSGYRNELTSTAVESAWSALLGDFLLWTGIACGLAVVLAVFASLARD